MRNLKIDVDVCENVRVEGIFQNRIVRRFGILILHLMESLGRDLLHRVLFRTSEAPVGCIWFQTIVFIIIKKFSPLMVKKFLYR
jgi:hypothetical protein